MSTTAAYSVAVAEEVRAMMARRQVRQVDMAAALHLTQPAISDRLRGRVAWSVDDEVRRAARTVWAA